MLTIQDWEFIYAGGERSPYAVNKWFFDNYVLHGCDPKWLMQLFWLEIKINGENTSFTINRLPQFIDAHIDILKETLTSEQRQQYIDFANRLVQITPLLYTKYSILINSAVYKIVNALIYIVWKVFRSWKEHFTLWIHHHPTWERAWLNGNAILTFWELNKKREPSKDLMQANLRWVFPSFNSCRFGIVLGGEEQLHFSLGLGIVSLYLSLRLFSYELFEWISSKILRVKDLSFNPRSLEIGRHNDSIFLYLFSSEDSTERCYFFHVLDFLFGKVQVETKAIAENIPIDLKMPEETYTGKGFYSLTTYVRPRLPRYKKIMTTVKLAFDKYIKMPDDYDPICSVSTTFSINKSRSIEEIVEEWREDILERRNKLKDCAMLH